jgi:hypothetical protein
MKATFYVCYDAEGFVVEVLCVGSDLMTYCFHVEDESDSVVWIPSKAKLADYHQAIRFKSLALLFAWNTKVPGKIKSSIVEDVYCYFERGLPA